jgi:hypothetical protein
MFTEHKSGGGWRKTDRHYPMPLLPTHKKKAGIAEKKPKKILFT